MNDKYPRTTREAFGSKDDYHPWDFNAEPDDLDPPHWAWVVVFIAGLVVMLMSAFFKGI